jgi:hypothetical protein
MASAQIVVRLLIEGDRNYHILDYNEANGYCAAYIGEEEFIVIFMPLFKTIGVYKSNNTEIVRSVVINNDGDVCILAENSDVPMIKIFFTCKREFKTIDLITSINQNSGKLLYGNICKLVLTF